MKVLSSRLYVAVLLIGFLSGSFNAYGDDYENLGRTKEDVEELARKELEKKLADKLHKGAFFPTWKSPRFSWGLDPIVGVTYQNTSDAENNNLGESSSYPLN